MSSVIIAIVFILIFSFINRYKYLGLNLEKFVLVAFLTLSLITFFIPDTINGQNTSLWNLAFNHNSLLPYLYIGTVTINIGLFISKSTVKNIIATCLYFLNIVFYVAGLFASSSTTSNIYGLNLILYSLSVIFIIIYGVSVNPSLMNKKGIQVVTKVDKITPIYFSMYLAMIFIGILMVIGGLYFLYSTGKNDRDFYFYIIDLVMGVIFIVSSVISLIPKKKRLAKHKAK